jgi:hypothetical protein
MITLDPIPNGESAMSKELNKLVDMAREVQMTPDQLREQRQSFVYGNTHIENDRITRALVAEVDEALEKAEGRHS